MGKKTTDRHTAGGQKGGQGFSLYPRGKSSPSSWNGDGESMFLGVARTVDPAHTRLPSPFPSPLVPPFASGRRYSLRMRESQKRSAKGGRRRRRERGGGGETT